MKTWPEFRQSAAKLATALACVLALAGAAAGMAHVVHEEHAVAGALVVEGQAELQKGDRGRAALLFERARTLAPRSEIVASALAAADIRAPTPFVLRAVHWLSPREWSILAVAAGWCAGLCLAIAIARRRSGRLVRWALFASAAFVLGLCGVMESNARPLAVITTPAVGVLVAPYPGAGSIGEVRAGSVVRMESSFGAFVKVHAADEIEGWVPRSALELVAGAS